MKTAKSNELITLNVSSTSHDGRGIASIKGKVTFVEGAIEGETALCHITKKNSRYNEAQAVQIITSVPERITPTCEHYDSCGGCSLQHMNHLIQIQMKQKILLDQLKHIGKTIPNLILDPIVGEPWFYRRKARLGVKYIRKRDQIVIGFREKSSNSLTDIHTCPILPKKTNDQILALKEVIRSLSQYDYITQIEIAIGDNESAFVIRHLKDLSQEDIAKLCEFAKLYCVRLYLQPNPPLEVHKIWPKESSDTLSYFLETDKEPKLEIQFHPLDFIQVNGEMNKLLVLNALKLLNPNKTETVLDLFCGLGNFTLPLAQKAHSVTGIEGTHSMVNRAAENAEKNAITNVKFYTANLMEPPSAAVWMKKNYDKILLDPPRSGAKEILPFIANCSATKICYISCNPATLARDAKELVYTHGYQLQKIGLVNMFPHTSHIEAIALFEK